jgi:hypothetical protein
MCAGLVHLIVQARASLLVFCFGLCRAPSRLLEALVVRARCATQGLEC